VREEDTELDAGTTNQVFWWSLGIALTAFVWALVNPEGMTSAVQGLTSVALESLDWFFLLLATFLLITALYLAFSRYGKLRLGRDDERPEFTTGSWLSMLFAAGMGAGLLFWGIAEPITHFQDPPGFIIAFFFYPKIHFDNISPANLLCIGDSMRGRFMGCVRW